MFRNPVYDMFVVVPALLIAGLISWIVMASPARAAEPQEAVVTKSDLSSMTLSACTRAEVLDSIRELLA